MTFTIPKSLEHLNSMGFWLMVPCELSDVDIDRLMTPVLEMAVRQGRKATIKPDKYGYQHYLTALSNSPGLDGFTHGRGREFLDGWLRTSIMKIGNGEKMEYMQPLTIAIYRSGLVTRIRNRQADDLAYKSMVAALEHDGSQNPKADIKNIFMNVFGRGVDVGTAITSDPRYDGTSDIDINSLLQLFLLEEFEGSQKIAPTRHRVDEGFALPGAITPIGSDMLRLLKLYGPKMPPAEAMSLLVAILALRLFQMPLRMGVASRQLLRGDVSADVESADADNPLEIFCDFTRVKGGPSDELSRTCIRRDLDNVRSFFTDRLVIRSLHESLRLVDDAVGFQFLSPSEQLKKACELRTHLEMQLALKHELSRIYDALDDSEAGDEGRALINEVRRSGLNAADQLGTVLVEGLRARGLKNQMLWFHTSGGLDKSYGILSGSARSRASWRYAPSDELLTALLALAFVEPDGQSTANQLPIAEVLQRLDRRFGVLIARPPRMFDDPGGRAGAAANLEAFTRKLQLLGCFQSLSDDFSAQYVNRPREAVA
ncbi:hypothetical protein [Dactylosporangium matsuzakiense]|uniref:Uncharacterized protein n=1 Tax=Dactylosporangium matsuzakiense TaxID=53360 RepID=A0A9W6KEA4_9ACTN|nr:hypothetical protein [Dactylosporangium matsuzakiense]UWZ45322.1 hypothetical protein Dmats_01845 [Dactylosporangium matsuzakiense]GLK98700.1 hypothetical protein GCM10017581_004410 [Dactylosporangium matsuzakiense]